MGQGDEAVATGRLDAEGGSSHGGQGVACNHAGITRTKASDGRIAL
ncbi:MAG: hypothetical protein ABW080_04680 [Candidatus Thiodiazotropha sp.]